VDEASVEDVILHKTLMD